MKRSEMFWAMLVGASLMYSAMNAIELVKIWREHSKHVAGFDLELKQMTAEINEFLKDWEMKSGEES